MVRIDCYLYLSLITAPSKTSLKAGNLMGEAEFIRSPCCVNLPGVESRGEGGGGGGGGGCYFSNIKL